MTLRTVTCFECDGYGGFDADERVYGWRECTTCAGRGEYEVEIVDEAGPVQRFVPLRCATPAKAPPQGQAAGKEEATNA